jgi:hypothetical protein
MWHKKEYKESLDRWVSDIKELDEIAKDKLILEMYNEMVHCANSGRFQCGLRIKIGWHHVGDVRLDLHKGINEMLEDISFKKSLSEVVNKSNFTTDFFYVTWINVYHPKN